MADRRDDERRFRGDRRDPEADRRSDRLADRYRGSDERGYGGGERLGRDWERGDMRGPERTTRDDMIRSADEERFDWGRRGREDSGSRELPRAQGERRFRDMGRDQEVRRYAELDRDRRGRDSGDIDREDWRASPSGAFHDELREERERPRRYGDRTRPTSLLYDTDQWSAGSYGLGAGDPGDRGDAGRYGGDVGRTGPERGRHGSGTRGFGELPERGDRPHYSLAGLHDLDDLSELRQRYSESHRQRDYEPRYGHGPGVENMEPLRTGYGTSTTRRGEGDHELGHGGMLGGTSRAGAPRPMGRGPKGYQRSDERIREELCDRLMMSWMDAENVDILVRDGEVTLQGTVKSRDEKRAIEALAESVLGVKDVHNTLRVQREGQVGTGARPEQRGEQLPVAHNREGQAQAPDRRGLAQERRAQDQEQTSVQQPGDTPLHS
jgi:hypothetical protein